MATSTSSSTVFKDGKMITTKTVTTTTPDGKTTKEIFVEEHDDDKSGHLESDFFKMMIKDKKDNFVHDIGEEETDSDDTINNSEPKKNKKYKDELTTSFFQDKDGNLINTKNMNNKKARKDDSDTSDDSIESEAERVKKDVKDQGKPSSPEGDKKKFSKFQLSCLASHNKYRALHGVGNLKLSKKLCVYAQEWADKLLAENLFQHRPDHKYGENIYSSWSSSMTRVGGGVAVDSWYSEIEQHIFGEENNRGGSTGHFTQVVWDNSKKLGVGVAQREGKVIVVANYDPPGNYRGQYAKNVPPPL